jgi:hypothetical protein
MKHISEQYGATANLLQCSGDDFEAISAFLKGLGVRCRVTSWNVGGSGEYIIQAENPYKGWIRGEDRYFADRAMTDEAISAYQR